MNELTLQQLISQGESETVEFKSSFNVATIESLVAFANTKGGSVLVGVSDKGKIVGCDVSNESVQQWINEIKSKTEPQLTPDAEIITIDDKIIVVLQIAEYPIKPVSIQGRFYKRTTNSNHQMSVMEIADEHLRTKNTSWDYYIDNTRSINDISLQKVRNYMFKIENKIGHRFDMSEVDFLSKLEYLKDGNLTMGAYLLFAKDNCLFTDLQIGRFKSEITIIDKLYLSTDLFTEVEETMQFIKKNLMVEIIVTGEPQHTERYNYPLDAIREIVINMIVHRDYRDSGNSIIKIFDDKIEFYNPGLLYGDLTVEQLLSGNYSSKSRNKLIAKAFKDIDLIEQFGSGIRRICDICTAYGLVEPTFKERNGGFLVTMYAKKIEDLENPTENPTENPIENPTENLQLITPLERKIIEKIKNNTTITQKQIAEQLGIGFTTVREYIGKLKQKGVLTRIGPDKGGYWKIIEKRR